MTLVDTSAWVDYLRATGSRAHHEVRRLIGSDADICTTEPVVMEVLAGARSAGDAARLRRLLLGHRLVPVNGLDDHETAAELFRRCRLAGEPVRTTVDCLVAVVAMRAGVAVLHADRDFATIARHAPLRLA